MNKNDRVGLEGVFIEKDLPLLIRREGIADWCDGVVRILDRRALPHDERHIDCESVEDVARCIENMVIQGAFSLSVAAGYGLALAVSDKAESDCRTQLTIASERLKKTRPTGLAISRMMVACLAAAEHALAEGNSPRDAILATVERGAVALSRQAYEVGRIACEILPDDATILTHCFPDRPYAYMLVEARRIGKPLKVIVSETRPYLQGARLTSLCAMQTGFDVHVITDGMGGFLMRRGEIDAFVTAADRVCMDGTVCNKIGTYQHALAAKTNGLPYYVLRQSGPDIESAGESSVEVEFRDGEEIVNVGGTRIAPSDVKGLYPAFDITPPDLVSKIITDRGAFPASEIASYVDATPFITDAVV